MRIFFLFLALVVSGAYIEYTAGEEIRDQKRPASTPMTTTTPHSETEKVFMDRAVALSFTGLENREGGPFGSVVVKDGKIVGEGWNQSKKLNDPSAHAEVMAIRDAYSKGMKDLKGCVVYASGQPCPMCLSLIYLTGAEKVYYLIPGEEIARLDPALSVEHVYEALRLAADKRAIPEEQIMSGEASRVVEEYRKYNW